MPPLVCPKCRHTNPESAVYCYFDGAVLQPGRAGADPNRLPQDFYFASGRQCRTFDELLRGCQENWEEARELLRKGVLEQFFANIGRLDLAHTAGEARGQPDLDIALWNLLSALPGTGDSRGPKIDLSPRRFALGGVTPGDNKKFALRVVNRGGGTLQGTLSIVEGGDWLRLGTTPAAGQAHIQAEREQVIPLLADARGLAAARTYGGKLRVISNGGVVEAPVQLDVVACDFPRAPFQGARTPREMAKKMKNNAKAAVAILESGELARWFEANNWSFPIQETPAKNLAGVQQFFEAMGLSRPPAVRLSHAQVQLTCTPGDRPRGQVTLSSPEKKYVYATVTSDSPWLTVQTPAVNGPQHAGISFEVDPRQVPAAPAAQGTIHVLANGGAKLAVRVSVEVRRPRPTVSRSLLAPVLSVALLLGAVRLLLAPAVDGLLRPSAVEAAAGRAATGRVEPAGPVSEPGGWLRLPWAGLLLTGDYALPDDFYAAGQLRTADAKQNFRDYFISYFTRRFILLTFWVGTLAWVVHLYRRNGPRDALWGVLSGLALGVVASATVASVLLVLDLAPYLVWSAFLSGLDPSWFTLALWIPLAAACWGVLGAALGFTLRLLGPAAGPALAALQGALAALLRLAGLKGLAAACAPV